MKVEAKTEGSIGAVIKSDSSNVQVSGVAAEDIVSSQAVVWGFAGGVGSKKSPYLISSADEFANINSLGSKMKEGQSYYFKQIADLRNVIMIDYINGGYDGGNYILEKQQDNCYYLFNEMTGHTTFLKYISKSKSR